MGRSEDGEVVVQRKVFVIGVCVVGVCVVGVFVVGIFVVGIFVVGVFVVGMFVVAIFVGVCVVVFPLNIISPVFVSVPLFGMNVHLHSFWKKMHETFPCVKSNKGASNGQR